MSSPAHRARAMLVDDEQTWKFAVAETLRAQGFEVSTATRVSEALAQPLPDLLVCETSLPDGSGFHLLDALHEGGSQPHTVFLSTRPTLHECREALRRGAADYLGKPFRLDDLLRAIERTQDDDANEHAAAAPADPTADGLAICSRATNRAAQDGIQQVLAFLVRRGIAPSTRARVASAVGELLENIVEHAYAPDELGTFELWAHMSADILEIEVRDRGVGIGVVGPVLAPLFATQNRGLQRAATLAESFHIEPRDGGGTRAAIRFRTSSAVFEEDVSVDLSELDYLPPEMARRVLDSLENDEEPSLYNLSPALAVVIGRLLSSTAPGTSTQQKVGG